MEKTELERQQSKILVSIATEKQHLLILFFQLFKTNHAVSFTAGKKVGNTDKSLCFQSVCGPVLAAPWNHTVSLCARTDGQTDRRTDGGLISLRICEVCYLSLSEKEPQAQIHMLFSFPLLHSPGIFGNLALNAHFQSPCPSLRAFASVRRKL